MTIAVFAVAAIAMGLSAGTLCAGTLDDVKARGKLRCGINIGLVGFATQDTNGVWTGFDVDFCRAVAAAVLGDPSAVDYTSAPTQERLEGLAAGSIDMVSGNTTWTLGRNGQEGIEFVGVNYYDGQGFMVRKTLGVASAKELEEASVCVKVNTTTELNLADFFRANNISYEPVKVESNQEAQQRYLAENCDVYTTDASGLAATRASFKAPTDHIVLPEIISKEPLGPAVRENDSAWADVVRWTLNALIAAEEYGITSANVEELSAGTNIPEINRILGTEGDLGGMLGLGPQWAKAAIMAVGNYGEVFERNIGEKSAIGLPRGLNAQWTNGGLLYAPPFR